MKKVLIAVASLVVIFILGSYLVSNATQKLFEQSLKNLQDLKGISVSNKSYEKGLFSSKASAQITITGEALGDFIPRTSLPNAKKLSMKYKFDSDIKNFLGNTSSVTKITSIDEHAEAIKKLFGSAQFASINSSKSLFGGISSEFVLKDIDVNDKQEKIKTSGIIFKTDHSNNGEVSALEIEIKKIAFDSRGTKINVNDVFYYYETKKALSFKDFYTKVVPSKTKTVIKEISISDRNSKMNIKDIDGISDIVDGEENGLVNATNTLDIKSINFEDIEFKNISLDTSINRLEVNSLNSLLQDTDTLQKNPMQAYKKIAQNLLDKKPEFIINKFSIENKKDNKANLNLKLALKEYNPNISIEKNKFNLEGKLEVDGGIKEFFFQVTFLQNILGKHEDRFFIKNGDKKIMVFKYDNDMKDMLINQKPLKSLF